MEGEEKEESQKKMRTTRKRRLAVDKWDEYGSQMEQRDYKDLSSMSVAMTQVAGLYFLLDCSTLSSVFSLGLVSFKFTSPCVEYVTKNRITK